MITNNYKLHFNTEGYIIGFETTDSEDYEYTGQMSQFPDACRGWTKFVDNTLKEDETKKAEILAQEEAEMQKQEKELHRVEAQITYTALMTDTCLEEDQTMKDKIKKWYNLGLWTKLQVHNAVPKLITTEEYEEITGEPYIA